MTMTTISTTGKASAGIPKTSSANPAALQVRLTVKFEGQARRLKQQRICMLYRTYIEQEILRLCSRSISMYPCCFCFHLNNRLLALQSYSISKCKVMMREHS